MSRRLSSLRAVEWASLAFLLFVVVRCGPGVFAQFRELAGVRTITVFVAMAVVALAQLLRDGAALTWPADRPTLARVWFTLGFVAALPLFAGSVIALTTPQLRDQVARLDLAQAIPTVANTVLIVIGLGLPTLLVWAALGVHLKTNDQLVIGRFLRESALELRSTLREWAPILLILSAYAWMDAVVRGQPVEERDALLASIDRALFFGRDPLDLVALLINRPLSEWLAFSYSFYALLYPLVLGATFLRAGKVGLRDASFTLGLPLLFAYVLYVLVPVKGPLLTRTFSESLELYTIDAIKHAMMDATRITYDCFPSMHTCTTILLSVLAHRYARRLFWVTLPVVVSMPLACVYLRYHYVTDVIAGLCLAAAMTWLSRLRVRAALETSRRPSAQEA